jgi:phosphoribosyl 1,2-cyclic phosphodiesterase
MTDEFRIRFRGVRGSYAVPGPMTNRFGGNTPCVEVRVGSHLIILDAGTGIIGLGKEMVRDHLGSPVETRGRLRCTILLTHMHHDHIQGYPFFGPLYLAEAKVHVFGPRMLREDLASALSGAMVAPYFPVDAESLACERHIRNIAETDALVFSPPARCLDPRVVPAADVSPERDEVVVRCYHSQNHPRGGVFVYGITFGGRKFVFASDTEGYVGGDQRLIRLAEGADLLVHDAQYRTHEYLDGKQGWGHSTIEMSVDVARQAKVRQLVLFHHAPTSDDDTVEAIEREAQEHFPNAIAAFEGLEIAL